MHPSSGACSLFGFKGIKMPWLGSGSGGKAGILRADDKQGPSHKLAIVTAGETVTSSWRGSGRNGQDWSEEAKQEFSRGVNSWVPRPKEELGTEWGGECSWSGFRE